MDIQRGDKSIEAVGYEPSTVRGIREFKDSKTLPLRVDAMKPLTVKR